MRKTAGGGELLALGAAAALAVVGARKRGSPARWQGPATKVRQAAGELRELLQLPDVRVSRDGVIYLLGAARTLEGLLRNPWKISGLMRRVYKDRWTVMSYAENANHWDGLKSAVNAFMLERTGGESYWIVLPVPSPGGPQRQTWSAKKGRVVPATKVKPFRFCDQEPIRLGSPTNPALLDLGRRFPPIFISHAAALGDLRAIERCGGFLWPSFAVTWRVPPAYGDVVFLAPATLLPATLRPTGKPRQELYLAGTDIWSVTGRRLEMMERAINHQLRGDTRWWRYGGRTPEEGGWGHRGLQNDLLIRAATRGDWAHVVGGLATFNEQDVEATDKVTSRRQLVHALRQVYQRHVVDQADGDPHVYPQERFYSLRSYRYPYLELKAIGVVPVGEMVVALYPRRNRRRVEGFLDRTGFRGFRVPFAWEGPSRGEETGTLEGWDEVRRRWASTVTRKILEWAENPCRLRGVKVAEQLRGMRTQTYNSILDWRKSRPRGRSYGFCPE